MSLQVWLPLNKRNDSDKTNVINNGLKDVTMTYNQDYKNITLPVTAQWYNICYGIGKFVAAVTEGSDIVAYSMDGFTWKQTTLPVSGNWQSMCYGNGKFVAVDSNAKMVYSTDGINWIQNTLPAGDYRTICYGNGKFISITYNSSNAAYSTDGITWTKATLPVSANWYNVCYGNGKFVAVAYSSNIAAYSTNGTTWTQTTLPTSAGWCSVCYGNGKFVATLHNVSGSGSNIAAYSTDGITWKQSTLPASGCWYNVRYGNGKFVAITANNNSKVAAYSTDGINWTQTTLPAGDCRTICYGNGKFVAPAFNSNTVNYSTDGITWSNTDPCPVYTNAADRVGGLALNSPVYINNIGISRENFSMSLKLWFDNSIKVDPIGESCDIAYCDTCFGLMTTSDYLELLLYRCSSPGTQIAVLRWDINILNNLQWNYLAFTFDYNNDIIKFYLNGKLIESNDTVSLINYVNYVYLAAPNLTDHDCRYTGYKIQDFRLYDNILLPEEIEEMAQDVIAHFPLGDVNETYVVDKFNDYYRDGNINNTSYATEYYDKTVNDNYTTITLKKSYHDSMFWTNKITFNPNKMCYLAKLMIKINKLSNSNAYIKIMLCRYTADTTDSVIYKVDLNNSDIGIWKEVNLYDTLMDDYECKWSDEDNSVIYGKTIDGEFKHYIPHIAIQIINSAVGDSISLKNIQLIETPDRDGHIPFVHNGLTELGSKAYMSTMPSTKKWRSICYGNGRFVAVAFDSNIAGCSVNGINWAQTTLPAVDTGYGYVCYGNGKFVTVAFNSNIAAYSTNGQNWTKTTLPVSGGWYRVCYGNGKFVAICHSINNTYTNIAAYSTDGINWTKTTLPASANWYSVCYGNGKFVTVAFNSNIATYSTNGQNWTKTTLPVVLKWDCVCFANINGNGRFVAAAAETNIAAYSTDGINWTKTTMPATVSWLNVTYGNGKFVAVAYGTGNVAAYSTNGINWYKFTLPIGANWNDVAYGDGKFVAVIDGSNRFCYMYDNNSFDYRNNTTETCTSIGNNADSTFTCYYCYAVSYGDKIYVSISYKFIDVVPSSASISNIFSAKQIIYYIDLSTKKLYLSGGDTTPTTIKDTGKTITYSGTLPKHIPVVTDKYGNSLAILPSGAVFGDLINEGLPSTSLIDSKYYGSYIATVFGDMMIFVSSVALPDSQLNNGVCVITGKNKTISKIFSIILPVKPPYIAIFMVKNKIIVVPKTGNKLCVSEDGSKWDTITIPYNKTWLTGVYGPYYNLGAVFLSSNDKHVYYSYDMNYWHEIIPQDGAYLGNIINIMPRNDCFILLTEPVNGQVYKYTSYETTIIPTQFNGIKLSDTGDDDLLSTTNVVPRLSSMSPVGRRSYCQSSGANIILTSPDVYNNVKQISMSVWVKPEVSWEQVAKYRTNILLCVGFDNSGYLGTKHYSELSNDWHLFTITSTVDRNNDVYYGESNTSLYIDKECVIDNDSSYSYMNNSTFGGGGRIDNYNGNYRNWCKMIMSYSDIKIYGKILTKEDVANIYDNTVSNDAVAIYKDGSIKAISYKEKDIPENLLLGIGDFEFYKVSGTKEIINASVHNREVKYTFNDTILNDESGLKLSLPSSVTNYLIAGSKYRLSIQFVDVSDDSYGYNDISIGLRISCSTKPNLYYGCLSDWSNTIEFEYASSSDAAIYIKIDCAVTTIYSIGITDLKLEVIPSNKLEDLSIDKYGELRVNEIVETDNTNGVSINKGIIKTNNIK